MLKEKDRLYGLSGLCQVVGDCLDLEVRVQSHGLVLLENGTTADALTTLVRRIVWLLVVLFIISGLFG